jgi:hypothetical protein
MINGTSLMGGLGNQLFQLAFSLYAYGDTDRLELVPTLKNVRRNRHGFPEIHSLVLPEYVRVLAEEFCDSRIGLKLMGLGLRQSMDGRARIVNKSLQVALSISKLRYEHIFFAPSTGFFDPKELHSLASLNGSFFVGYFQSSRFFEDAQVTSVMRALRPTSMDSSLLKSIREVERTRPMMVHVRLTDYLLNPQFGQLTPKYFQVGIERLQSAGSTKKIWVFSDDPASVQEFLPREFRSLYYIVDSKFDPVQTMELMKYFSAFLISNSSFSWWAASLRKDLSAPVIVPHPWFTSQPTSRELIGPNWIMQLRD